MEPDYYARVDMAFHPFLWLATAYQRHALTGGFKQLKNFPVPGPSVKSYIPIYVRATVGSLTVRILGRFCPDEPDTDLPLGKVVTDTDITHMLREVNSDWVEGYKYVGPDIPALVEAERKHGEDPPPRNCDALFALHRCRKFAWTYSQSFHHSKHIRHVFRVYALLQLPKTKLTDSIHPYVVITILSSTSFMLYSTRRNNGAYAQNVISSMDLLSNVYQRPSFFVLKPAPQDEQSATT